MVSLKTEVVDENALRTIPRSDLVCVPYLMVVGLAVFAKNANIKTNRWTEDKFYLLDLTVCFSHSD